nr:putative integron gene cassette protein [uncultured bacterium]
MGRLRDGRCGPSGAPHGQAVRSSCHSRSDRPLHGTTRVRFIGTNCGFRAWRRLLPTRMQPTAFARTEAHLLSWSGVVATYAPVVSCVVCSLDGIARWFLNVLVAYAGGPSNLAHSLRDLHRRAGSVWCVTCASVLTTYPARP